ncbi:MAG: Kelch repeat-containing protein, partial [Thermoanaerobaculia bacterium]
MPHHTGVTSLLVLLMAASSLSAAPTLGAARANHTATLLPNGKVLIAGGTNGGNLSSAELYDPATGIFTPTGPMNAARSSHTATVLPNGKVLLAGGSAAAVFSPSLSSAELYDPATGVFTPTGSMTSPRASQTATLLADGRVLMAGGSGGISSLQTAELFDPLSGANGTFTATATMTGARANHTAVLLPNGQVLLAGGIATLNAIGSAELFDPAVGANGSFTATPNMNAPRSGHSATLLANGKVLIGG